MSNAGNIRSQMSPSNIVNKGRALLDQVRQLWQEKLILPNGVGSSYHITYHNIHQVIPNINTQDINGKKMSWCLLVTSGVFCLLSMLITIGVGLSMRGSLPCHNSSFIGDPANSVDNSKGQIVNMHAATFNFLNLR